MAMENLIASRNDKASRLIEMIGQKVLIELRPPKPLVELNGRQAINLRYYELLSCDAHAVTIEDVMYRNRITEPLSRVEILPTMTNGCTLMLLITDPNHAHCRVFGGDIPNTGEIHSGCYCVGTLTYEANQARSYVTLEQGCLGETSARLPGCPAKC